MLIAKALPDELVHGYRGRLQRLNILSNSDRLTKGLRERYLRMGTECDDSPVAVLLAMCSCMRINEFIRAHTLLPFHRAVTSIKPELAHGDPSDQVIIRNSTFRLSKAGASLCPDCVAEDKAFWGFAYWRRTHQLPGIDCCPKHGTPLQWAPSEADLDWQPDPSTAVPVCISADERNNPVVQRFTEIMLGLLDREHPLSCFECSSKLSLKAQSMGIRIAKAGRNPNLSDMALRVAPRKWLLRWFPGIEHKKRGEYFPPIDRAVRQTGTPIASALALALLFRSADEALDFWNSQNGDFPTAPRMLKRVGSDFWNSRNILNLYEEHCGNVSKIAASIKHDDKSTYGALQNAGLPALGLFDFNTTGNALVSYFNGASLAEACSRFGADQRECDRILRISSARFASALRKFLTNESGNKRSRKNSRKPYRLIQNRQLG